ncbi:MAG: hypothetical protein ACT4OS_05730 [Acidimicrobiales bacterium]
MAGDDLQPLPAGVTTAVRRLAAARFISFTGTGAAQIALVSSPYERTGSSV